jgi:hypothetical protein
MILFSKKYTKSIFNIVIFLMGLSCWSQNILISQGGTVNVSGGEMFYDAGGAAGNDGNTSHTITLCPSVAGQKVLLDFTQFTTFYDSSSRDVLNIHNGNSTTAANIGLLTGNYSNRFSNGSTPFDVGSRAPHFSGSRVNPISLIPDVFSPTIFSSTSPDGCLTLHFVNSSTQQSSGWVANVSLYKPADVPGCNIDLSALNTSICVGQSTTLKALGTITSTPINNN